MLVEIVIAIVLGLVAGIIINVMADDLPLRRPLRLPRYVPDAKKRAIHARGEDLSEFVQQDDEKRPVIAWSGIAAFLTGNRVSSTGVVLSWRYPITEVFTVIVMLLVFLASRNQPGLEDVNAVQILFFLLYAAILSLVTVIDIEHRLILFVVIVPSCMLALIDALLSTVVDSGFYQPNLRDALFGGLMGFAIFFLMYNGGFLFTYIMGALRGQPIEEVAFGYGDVMLATLSGLILGWQALIFAMFITVFLGAFGAVLYLISRRLIGVRYSAFTALPYGPYIVIGTLVMLLYRIPVTDFLMRR